jgi:hypothetical protein
MIIQTAPVENLVIEIVDSTLIHSILNPFYSDNIHFYTNTSSNNTIRIVNSSLYGNYSNIVPNDNLDGFMENLVLEILDSTLNASNYYNIYFSINTSSNNTIRIVNSSMYANLINIVPNNNNPNNSVENLVIEIVGSTLNASNYHNIYFYTNTSSNNTIRIVNSSLYGNYYNIRLNDNPNGSVENLVIEIVDSTLNSSSSSNLVINNNESKNTFIKINNSRLLAYGHIIQYRNNFNYNNHLKILNSELRGTIYSNIKFGPEISLSTNINNSVEVFNSTILTLLGTNIFYANGTNIGNNLTISSSTFYSIGSTVYFLSDSVNLDNIVQINDSILESKYYANIHFDDSNSSTNRNNTVIILRSNLSTNNTNFLLRSLNKTLNDYNVFIVNTSLIGNVSFNLTEITLNISGFNNLFLSDQHFVNSSSNISGILNISKTLGTSIIGTPYLGGNYWEGYSNLCPDFDGDGLCELPYVINSNAIDYLPLTNHTQHGTVLSGNFSTNAIPLFNISINVSPSINYTIYLYINGTLYNSISGSGAGNYSLGATLGSGNYTYWFVVNYTIGGFDYSYTYGNYSAYIDVNPPYVEIIDPKPLDYPSEPIVFLFNVSDDMNISCNFLLTRDSTLVLNQSFSTSGLYNYTYSLVPGQYNLTLICSDGLNTNSTFVLFNSSNYSDPSRFNVISGNFSSNSSSNVFNVFVNATGNYTIYLYINGTLYNSISGSGAGNYSLGATLGSGNYTYWFVVNYTIGGFDYSYTYGNYSAYIDVNPPYVEIIDPKPLDYPSEPIVFLFNVSDDMNISCNFLLTRDSTLVLNQSFSTSGLYNYTYSLVPGQYNLTLICSDGLNTNSTFVLFNSSNYSDPSRFNVISGNFSSNSSSNVFNVFVNATGNYTIYLYINGTLYNSISGSGAGNYSLGATLGSGNYTYWFVVNYTIGGFDYSYTYGNYSVYVDVGLPSISILWPVDGESYTRGNRIIQILVIDDLSSTLSCQLNVTGPDSFNDAFTISNGYVYNYSYNFNSLGLYTMNVSCNDGINQNQTSITFRIRESGGGSSNTMNGSNSDLNQSNNTLNDTTNGSNSNLNQSNNTFNNTMNNSNMNNTNQSIENNTTMNNNHSNEMIESDNVNNQGQPSRSKTTSRTQQSDLEQSENQTIQQNESQIIQEQTILNQTEEEEQKPSSEESVKDTEESKNVSQQDLISRINNYISIGLSEMIKLSSPFPYLILGSITLLLFRTTKLKIIPLQDRVILQFNNILDKPIKNLKVNIDGQELITDENGQIILSSMPKQIKPKLHILIKL